MSFQKFCEHIHIFARNDLITQDTSTGKFVLDKLLDPDNEELKKLLIIHFEPKCEHVWGFYFV